MIDGLEREVRGVEDAERRAGVPHVREVEEARARSSTLVVQRQLASDHRLGESDRATTISDRQPDFAAAAAATAAIDAWRRIVAFVRRDSGGQRVLAALAQPGPLRARLETRRHVAPAPLALHAAGALDRRSRGCASPSRLDVGRRRPQLDLRHDEQHRQVAAYALEQRELAGGADSTTFACSELPICLFLRSGSISASTRSRRPISRVPALEQLRDRRARRSSARGGNSAMCTDSSRAPGRMPPQLVGGERQDRRHQPRQAVGHQIHRRLRRAPLARPRGERVQAILRDVGVERAQIDRRERVQRLEDRAVLVVLVGLAGSRCASSRVAREDVAIDLLELGERRRDRPPGRSRRGSPARYRSVLRIFR